MSTLIAEPFSRSHSSWRPQIQSPFSKLRLAHPEPIQKTNSSVR